MIIKKEASKKFLTKTILENSIFIYPTDTIYGIGCDATNNKLVRKIRLLKERDQKPFSIIAPSKEWIMENCDLKNHEGWLEKLPGKYTLIVNLKNKESISREANNNLKTIGVRIPKHWISKIVTEYGKPIITTSVNLTGEKNMTSTRDINQKIKSQVDFIIDEGKLEGSPSTIVVLTEKKEKIIER